MDHVTIPKYLFGKVSAVATALPWTLNIPLYQEAILVTFIGHFREIIPPQLRSKEEDFVARLPVLGTPSTEARHTIVQLLNELGYVSAVSDVWYQWKRTTDQVVDSYTIIDDI